MDKLEEEVTLPAQAINDIRWALVHGLHAIAEVNRSQGEFESARASGKVSDDLGCLVPIALSASTDDLTRYAEALSWLEYAVPVAR